MAAWTCVDAGDSVRVALGTADPSTSCDAKPANELELAALVYLPPGVEALAGAMCAAPEGAGFEVTFRDLLITRV